ncbi:MAG: DUF2384 domain-containing protein [Deltaproteobacteria bacterium]|nr:DUF2384 domain-containing protein [Deltaproteobacteria bacterium]
MKTAETIAGKLASCEVSIASVLGGAKFLHKKIENRLDLVNLVDEGISKASLLHLARYLHFSTKQMAEVLPVTERTIQRYDNEKQFAPVVSDHILQIAEVSAKGTAVFQDKIKFLLWMNNPCTSFANKTPKSLLKSKFGIDMILDELGRIEHGIFS